MGDETAIIRVDAAAAADWRGVSPGPVAALIECAAPSAAIALEPSATPSPVQCEHAIVLAIGTPHEVDRHPAAHRASSLGCWPLGLLIPGLVNAHAHLDLTHMGPLRYDPEAGFVGWVDRVRAGRLTHPERVAEAVGQGAALSLRGGVVAVGDIAGAVAGRASLAAARALAETGLHGVSYVEFFAQGRGEQPALVALDDALDEAAASGWGDRQPARGGVRLGLQPHAPYSVSLGGYRRAVALAAQRVMPIATHLAETDEEREFVSRGSGPHRDLLERVGVWEPELAGRYADGVHPIAHLAGVLDQANADGRPLLTAHVNDLGRSDHEREAHMRVLSSARVSVAYCPRASAYFSAPARFGPHPYLALLDAGVNVCLGTDSILNLPPDEADRISVWDDARLLADRDSADPELLLDLITRRGAIALGLEPDAFELRRGARLAGLAMVPMADGTADPLRRALRSAVPPRLLLLAGHFGR